MPKKILYESAIHQLLWAGKRLRLSVESTAPSQAAALSAWLSSLEFKNPGPSSVLVTWTGPKAGTHVIALQNAKFYTRGDTSANAERQIAAGLPFSDDRVMEGNAAFFAGELKTMLSTSGLLTISTIDKFNPECGAPLVANSGRKQAEEVFHDQWAASEDVTNINVRHRNEACTAPEMRHIRRNLGDLRGKTLLDVGCGLGEASVYFALEGAIVTATDISPGMCEATQKLASANGVTLETHVSAIEDLGLGSRSFDIIYTGNTLHHADLPVTLDNVLRHLKPDGMFASWDPVAYNPIINVYRAIATKVRTPDEHPLRLRDIREVTSRFKNAEVSWFWFTSLLVFILMVIVQLRSPNKERFWKKVIDEADTWAWLYRPLAALDRGLLNLLPFLRPLCWNVVIVAKAPHSRAKNAALKCFVCSSSLGTSSDTYTICPGCGHRHANNETCGEVVNEQLQSSRARRLDSLTTTQLKLIDRVAMAKGTLLDVGAGTGKFIYHAKGKFNHVAGIEVSEASFNFASTELQLEMHRDVADTSGPFDLITSWHAFEHIPECALQDTLRNLRARSHNNTRMLICVPNPDSWLAKSFGRHWAFRDTNSHVHEFSRQSLDQIHRRAGFTPEYHVKIFNYTWFTWVQSLSNLAPLPHNYIYYRIKRGWTFDTNRSCLISRDILASISLIPSVIIGTVLALVEHVFAHEKSVHGVVYRPN